MWRQRKFFPFCRKCLMLALWNLKLSANTKSSLHITRAITQCQTVQRKGPLSSCTSLLWGSCKRCVGLTGPNTQLTSMASPKHSKNCTIFSGFETLEPFFCELKFMKGENILTFQIVSEGLPCTTNLSLCVSFLVHILLSTIQNTKLLIFQSQFWGSSHLYQRNAIVRMD